MTHIFFFSSRRRHTRFDCDWSSDVCSSDLGKHTGRRLVENILGKSLDQESARTLTSRLKRLQERRSKCEIYRLVRLLDRERSGISEEELRRMFAKFPKKK